MMENILRREILLKGIIIFGIIERIFSYELFGKKTIYNNEHNWFLQSLINKIGTSEALWVSFLVLLLVVLLYYKLLFKQWNHLEFKPWQKKIIKGLLNSIRITPQLITGMDSC